MLLAFASKDASFLRDLEVRTPFLVSVLDFKEWYNDFFLELSTLTHSLLEILPKNAF